MVDLRVDLKVELKVECKVECKVNLNILHTHRVERGPKAAMECSISISWTFPYLD